MNQQTQERKAVLPPKRGLGLGLKFLIILLAVSLVPLAVSAILVGNLGEVAQNFARNHGSELRPHLENAQEAYRELIRTKKKHMAEVAKFLASAKEVRAYALSGDNREDVLPWLEKVVQRHSSILWLGIEDIEGVLGIESKARKEKLETVSREVKVRQSVGVAGAVLVVVFSVSLTPTDNLRELGKAIQLSKQVDSMQSALPRSYRLAFVLLVGLVVLVVTVIALLLAGQMIRRMQRLVAGTRKVARGDLKARVALGGNDELAELADAFNGMVMDLEKERQKTIYLERIGTWQDVARKLAHEIKNPLTPIQLVVQQTVSTYPGQDEKYKKLLQTCDEIVREEVDGLRRLVDAFRDLGRLPKVEAVALSCQKLIGDLKNDPRWNGVLEIDEPREDLTLVADRLLMRRILVNVVENAHHAGQEAGKPGHVFLRWRGIPGFVEIVVDDEGKGVEEGIREEIFDPYVSSKETGTGLGLAIAKKVALDHLGSLRLSSRPSPMGGARFILRIPLQDTKAAALGDVL